MGCTDKHMQLFVCPVLSELLEPSLQVTSVKMQLILKQEREINLLLVISFRHAVKTISPDRMFSPSAGDSEDTWLHLTSTWSATLLCQS